MTLGYLTKKVTAEWKQTFNFENYTGNLLERGYRYMNSPDSLRETFTYDNLERLTSSTVAGQPTINISYDFNGNILTRTGVGNYEYLPDKINAVKNITDIYDLALKYGPDQQRVKSVLRENGVVRKTKYFSINLEQEITSAGTRNIYYLSSPFGLVAINIRKNNIDSLYFTDTDHLGSIIALMKPDGTIREKYSYDPWGRRRNPTDWSYDSIPQPILTDRGFTGHEHINEFNLINMNGRVYDPVLGRFLSPDPIIQAPDFTQSYNGYSYCFNNPFKYVDPSGFLQEGPGDGWLKRLLARIFGGNNECDIQSCDEPKTKKYNLNSDKFTWKEFIDFVNTYILGEGLSTNSFPDYSGTLLSLISEIQNSENKNMDFDVAQTGGELGADIQNSEHNNMDFDVTQSSDGKPIFGYSVDLVLALGPIGGNFEIGEMSKIGTFTTYGLSYGVEASYGINLVVLFPKSNFTKTNFFGKSAEIDLNIGKFLSIAIGGDKGSIPYSTPSWFNSYTTIKIGIGLGLGGSYSPNSTTVGNKFLDYLTHRKPGYIYWNPTWR